LRSEKAIFGGKTAIGSFQGPSTQELKKRVLKIFPIIAACTGTSEADKERLRSAIQVTWDTIPNEFFDSLWKSTPDRVAACINAKGCTLNISAIKSFCC
jgi:hypothetical protein